MKEWSGLLAALAAVAAILGTTTACETIAATTLENPLPLTGAVVGDPDTVTIGFSEKMVITSFNGEGLGLFRKSLDKVLYLAVPSGRQRMTLRMYNGLWYSQHEIEIEIFLEPGKTVFITANTGELFSETFRILIREPGPFGGRDIPFRIIGERKI